MEGGAVGTRLRQGRGIAGVSWLGHQKLTGTWRTRVGHGRIQAGEGDSAVGLLGRCPLAQLTGRHRRPGGRQPLPLDETEQGRKREKETEGRERKSEGSG
jgi:hypothetical protein